MKKFLKWPLSILIWTGCKAIYITKETNGNEFSFEAYHKGRWYSPTFWIFWLLFLIPYVIKGGIIEWINNVYFALIKEDLYFSYSGEFKSETSWFSRKKVIFLLSYWESI